MKGNKQETNVPDGDIKALKDKFGHINFLKSKTIRNELISIKTIREKLEYLKTVKATYFDEYEKVVVGLSHDEANLYNLHRAELWESVFDKDKVLTPLKIQEPVFNEFFKASTATPEFTYWFLKYNANQLFNNYIQGREFKRMLASESRDIELQAKLNEINRIESEADNLLLEGKIRVDENYRNYRGSLWTLDSDEKHKHIEFLRIRSGYYKENPIGSFDTYGPEVYAFFRHKLLKPYLESLLIKEAKEDLTKKESLEVQPLTKYKTKHYVLAYIFDCYANGKICPIGNKKELERLGNERIGVGKGNTFYKVFNSNINKDLNSEKNLIEIGGENWRKAVLQLSEAPELVDSYLKNKNL